MWNRLYLISALLASFALPFIIYPESAPEIPVIYEVSAASFSVNYVKAEETSIFTWINAFIVIYLFAVLRRFYEMLGNIRQLKGFIRDGELIELEDCKVVLIDSNDVGSFSFLKWIVVNRNDYENHFDAILRHEMVHTSQGHTFDILFVEILRILFWFNPVLILYKNALQEVHEYLADEAAPNRENYANFLVSYGLNAPIAALTNHFFKPSQLKSRIEMIYKSRSSKWLRSSYILTFGFIGAIALLIAGCERIKKNFSESSSEVPGQEMDSTKTIQVKGWIASAETKLAIPGANVVVEGLQLGTTTDSDGKFVINAPAYSNLLISFPGFKTQLRPLNGISDHGIALSPREDTESSSSDQEDLPVVSGEARIQTLELPTEGKVFTVVEKQPEFPGGNKAMYKFLGNNIKYPTAAARANVSGRVFLSFVVTTNGNIQDVKILKGIGFGCDEEAVRVVSQFPKWKPGTQDGQAVNVKYNLPINFQIDNDDKVGNRKLSGNEITDRQKELALIKRSNSSGYTGQDSNSVFFVQQSPMNIRFSGSGLTADKQPLLVVDGKLVENHDGLLKINPKSIESIDVLKDHSATSKYGKKGINGVILITTKKATFSDSRN
ncbi:M56 family metallopeptidase [Dyadobacter sp. CY312]|uniref:M56 family metallopeptidase n=1 Tax=Dyadobacter sp. CY312 TaxID=2907303 RepID=UPI001F28BA13|nr:M56 family metallopeptidase [Dyadobacter sp. CY312]MCE7041983.1 TonB family protein [Dyadobacter sp. CY312]